jgi:hypothetical protein
MVPLPMGKNPFAVQFNNNNNNNNVHSAVCLVLVTATLAILKAERQTTRN